MFLLISDLSPNTATFDTVDKLNLIYISKFELPSSVAQHIDSCLIVNDIHIDNPSTASDIKLNSQVLNCLENYQLRPSLVADIMLEIFYNKFYRQGYTKFSKLDQYLRGLPKDTFMAKKIYMNKPSGHVNQRSANLVIEKQLPI